MRPGLSEPVPTPEPVRVRRVRRLCIDAHTEFVATLVAELQASVARLQSASRRLLDGVAADSAVGDGGRGPVDLSGVDRETKDIARLVGLLDAIDGRGAHRRLAPLSLAETIVAAAGDLDVAVAVSVALEATMDLADPRRSWQLRSGRRVLEGQGLRVRLTGGGPRYRVELSVGR